MTSLASSSTQRPDAATISETASAETFAAERLAAFGRGDTAALVAHYQDGATVIGPSGPLHGREQIKGMIEGIIAEFAQPGVTFELIEHHGAPPVLVDAKTPAVAAAKRAVAAGFGVEPVLIREGGSIPVVATFQEILGLPSVLFGVGLPDENAHAPNEKLDVANFHGGIISSAILYDEIASKR